MSSSSAPAGASPSRTDNHVPFVHDMETKKAQSYDLTSRSHGEIPFGFIQFSKSCVVPQVLVQPLAVGSMPEFVAAGDGNQGPKPDASELYPLIRQL